MRFINVLLTYLLTCDLHLDSSAHLNTTTAQQKTDKVNWLWRTLQANCSSHQLYNHSLTQINVAEFSIRWNSTGNASSHENTTNCGADETVQPLNSSIMGNDSIHTIHIQHYLAQSCSQHTRHKTYLATASNNCNPLKRANKLLSIEVRPTALD